MVEALDLGERDEFAVAGARPTAGGRSPAGSWPSCTAAGLRAAARAPRDHRGRAAGQRALVLGGAGGGAGLRARSASRRRTCSSWPSSARAWRTTGSGRRPACWTRSRRCCRAPGHVLRIDFRSLDVQAVPLDLGDWQLVTVDSGATHSHRRVRLQRAPRRMPRGLRARSASASLRDAGDIDGAAGRRCAGAPATCSARTRAWTPPRRRSRPATSRRSARCWTPRTRRCATTTRRPCRRSRPPSARLKAAGAAGARMVGGGFGGSVLALLPPGVGRPAGALAVAPHAPARLL